MVTYTLKKYLFGQWRRTSVGLVALIILGFSSSLANTAAGWVLVVLPAALIWMGECDSHRHGSTQPRTRSKLKLPGRTQDTDDTVPLTIPAEWEKA